MADLTGAGSAASDTCVRDSVTSRTGATELHDRANRLARGNGTRPRPAAPGRDAAQTSNLPPRAEYKYLLSLEHLDLVRRWLAPFVVADTHGGATGGYPVRSIYLDRPTLDDYHDKLAGLQHRQKFRIRGYGAGEPNDAVFLEIKRKNDLRVWKTRARVVWRDVPVLLGAGGADAFPMQAADRDAARAFLFHLHRWHLRPVVLVVYERQAFHARHDPDLRLTLDTDLRSAGFPRLDELFRVEGLRPCLPGRFVLELKFRRTRPGWVLDLLDQLQARRVAVSKYVHAVETAGVIQRGASVEATRRRILSRAW